MPITTSAENECICEICDKAIEKGSPIVAEAKGPAWAKYHKECAASVKEAKEETPLTEMWKGKLQDNYDSFEEFEAYNDNYGLAKRLGYASAEEAWKDNPMIQGSTDPKDFKKVGSRRKRVAERVNKRVKTWDEIHAARKANKLPTASEVLASDYDYDNSPEHTHEYGEIEVSRFAGNPHRKCILPGCKNISLDFNDEGDSMNEAFRLRPIGTNMNEVEIGPYTVLFSYQTPVAYHDGEKFYRTDASFSPTTSRHISKWLKDADAETVPQDEIEALVNQG